MLSQKLLPLLCILLLFRSAAAQKASSLAKRSSYQDLYLSCQNKEAACVVISFTQGYNRAFLTGKPIQCAHDHDANDLCTYGPGSGGTIRCRHADDIIFSSTGTMIQATLSPNASASYSSSGGKTSIFTASCLTKG